MTPAERYDVRPWEVLDQATAATTPRKLRLLMCGLLRSSKVRWDRHPHGETLDLIERAADGGVPNSALARTRTELRGAKPVYGGGSGWGGIDRLLWCAANPDAAHGVKTFHGSWAWAAEDARLLPKRVRPPDALSAAMREVLGNPFRPVAFSPGWRTSDVLLLARGAYEGRAFDRLPILADALQDAGCDSDEVLDHLRDPGPHLRGCWALDLALGRS